MPQRRRLAAFEHWHADIGDQARGFCVVGAGERLSDRFDRISPPGIIARRHAVQLRRGAGFGRVEPPPQHRARRGVQAIAAVGGRLGKDALRGQFAQHRRTVPLAAQQPREIGVEPRRDAAPLHEPAHRLGQRIDRWGHQSIERARQAGSSPAPPPSRRAADHGPPAAARPATPR
ncbi:hypothetical protein [Sphingopyxis sp. PET50]|uniref:hypothetical protein n=1 Tax=Sphingopyxis sp. PET50 TaxID=2976533 RepID=UPI0021AE3F09|nr:hypothetical protein [Sphingopyxis sp. PET50]